MQFVTRKSEIVNGEWLPDMDLNHDKQIQSLLCYRYTIGQTGALEKLKGLMSQSSRQTLAFLKEQCDANACLGHAVPEGQATIAQRFNAGLEANRSRVPKGRPRANYEPNPPTVPSGLVCQAGCFPALKRRAILKMSLRDKGKRHAFKGISRRRCPARKMWDTLRWRPQLHRGELHASC